jgi:hypothetical protein
VRSDLKPVLAGAAKTADDSDRAITVHTKPSLQLLNGAKLTAAEVAQTARDVRKAAPVTIDGIQSIVANSNKTTALTVKTMSHIEEDTRTLPKPLRLLIQLSPAAVPVVGVWELLHKTNP